MDLTRPFGFRRLTGTCSWRCQPTWRRAADYDEWRSLSFRALSLHRWDNFFIVAGTSAAALVGLLFGAITLGASHSTPREAFAASAFLTPTLINFGSALFERLFLLARGRPRGRSESFWAWDLTL